MTESSPSSSSPPGTSNEPASNASGSSAQAGSTPPSSRGPRKGRTLIVLGLLVWVAAGAAYDMSVVQPGYQRSCGLMTDLLEERSKKIDAGQVAPVVTPKEVAAKLGFGPSSSTTEGRYTIETFRHRSGLLVRSFNVYVAYAPGKTPDGQSALLMYNAFFGEWPGPEHLPARSSDDYAPAVKTDAEKAAGPPPAVNPGPLRP